MSKTFLFVKVPPTNQHGERAMDAMLASLHRLLPHNAPLSLELVSSNQFLKFYITTSPEFKNIIKSQLYAQFPDAEIEETKDYLPKSFSNIAIAQIDFKYTSLSPINTYKNSQESFLKSLSAILAKSDPNDEIFFQLALRRLGSGTLDRGFEAIRYILFPNPSYEKFSQDLYAGKLRIAYAAENKTSAKKTEYYNKSFKKF